MLHLVSEGARGGAILIVRMIGGAHPTLLRLGAVMRVVGLGFLAAGDERGRELPLCGEGAEDFAVRAEEVGGTCKGGDGMLGADIRSVGLEEDGACAFDLRQVCFHEVVGTAAPQPVAERDDIVRGEIRRRVLHAEEIGARLSCNLLGD